MQKILTVVVPTYNAEKYLKDNLKSFLIKKILPDIEILIINDGSTDHSLQIAEEFVRDYPGSFRVVSKKNAGHGSGINCGIEYASGKYFKVVDADDWVRPEPFLKLVHTLKNIDSDLVFSGFLWAFDCGEGQKENFKTKAEFSKPFADVIWKKEYIFDQIADQIYLKMHNITIKTEILKSHNIHLDEHCFYVDSEYITYPIPYVKTIYFLEEFVYMYRIGRQGQSVSIEKMQKNKRDYERVISSLLSFYNELEQKNSCSIEKREYIAGLIARVIAGRFKIDLSMPLKSGYKKELQRFDEFLKNEYPDIYQKNINTAIKLLRCSGYMLYVPIGLFVHYRYRKRL